MTSAAVVDQTGAEQGSLELPASVFSGPIHSASMHQALIRQLANRRQGSSSTLTRAEVRGGGRKPHRQKGTGRARQGSIRAPHYAGGGVVFGPHPRRHRLDMPRKQRRLALRSALAARAQDGALRILDGFAGERPRTRSVAELLAAVGAGPRSLFVLGAHNRVLELGARNLPGVVVVLAANLSVRDLLGADTVLITRDGLDHITGALGAEEAAG